MPVDRPLDVLGAPVVTLDLACDGAELLQLGVAQTGRAPPLVAHRDGLDATVGSRDVLDQLVGDLAHGYLAGNLAEDPAIRGHFTAHHGGTQAPGALDRHDRAVTGRRTAGEHHTGRAGIHHDLDHDGHCDVFFGKHVLEAIADRGHRVQARPAAAHALRYLRRTPDPQVRVLKTGETRIQRVLAGGRRAHRDRLLGARAHEPRLGGGELLQHLTRQLSPFHPAAQRPRAGRDRFEVVRLERRHRRAHRCLALERLQEPLER